MCHIEVLLRQMQDCLASRIGEQAAHLKDIMEQQRLLLNMLLERKHPTAALEQLQDIPEDPTLVASHLPRASVDFSSRWRTVSKDYASMDEEGAHKPAESSNEHILEPVFEESPLPSELARSSRRMSAEPSIKSGHSQTILGHRKTEHDVHTGIDATVGHKECKISITYIVTHRYFDYVVGIAILLNSVALMVDADFSVRYPGKKLPVFLDVIELLFFILFAVELAARLWAFRCSFFVSENWKWNWFDAMLVLTAGMELVMKHIVQTKSLGMMGARLLRIVRITRLVRILRVVKIFREFRVMIMSIVMTMRTLMWSLVCVCLISAAMGSYFAWAVAEHLAETDGVNSDEVKYFGSMLAILASLFQATTGGMDWRDLADILADISPFACLILYAYMSMMMYAVMNILTGICVSNANRAAEDDLDLSTEEMLQNNANIQLLRSILSRKSSSSNDRDEGIKLTWPKLKVHLGNPKVRTLFKKIDLEPWQLRSFFTLLQNGNEEPEVAIDNFIRGCMRLRCHVKNIDLMSALQETKTSDSQRHAELQCLLNRVFEMISKMGQRNEFLQKQTHAWNL